MTSSLHSFRMGSTLEANKEQRIWGRFFQLRAHPNEKRPKMKRAELPKMYPFTLRFLILLLFLGSWKQFYIHVSFIYLIFFSYKLVHHLGIYDDVKTQSLLFPLFS